MADSNLTASESHAAAVDPMAIPCPVRVCSADPGMHCKPGLRFHDERWQVAIADSLTLGALQALASEALGGDFSDPDPIPSLGRVLEVLEANKEGTLPALVAELDALGAWHPVLDCAHAVGEWRWVLSAHPGAR